MFQDIDIESGKIRPSNVNKLKVSSNLKTELSKHSSDFNEGENRIQPVGNLSQPE